MSKSYLFILLAVLAIPLSILIYSTIERVRGRTDAERKSKLLAQADLSSRVAVVVVLVLFFVLKYLGQIN